jgi:hypothetical protein
VWSTRIDFLLPLPALSSAAGEQRKDYHNAGEPNRRYAKARLKNSRAYWPRSAPQRPLRRAAVELTRQLMERLHFDNVRLQPIMVPHCARPVEEVVLINSPTVGTVTYNLRLYGRWRHRNGDRRGGDEVKILTVSAQ